MFELAGLNQRTIEIIAGPIAAIRCHNNQVVLIDQAEEQRFIGCPGQPTSEVIGAAVEQVPH